MSSRKVNLFNPMSLQFSIFDNYYEDEENAWVEF